MSQVQSVVEHEPPKVRLWVGVISLVVFVLVGFLMRHTPKGALGAEPGPLAQLNATLNGAATVCLGVGFLRIKAGDRQGHKRWMIGAFVISTLFLISYVLHHMQVGTVPFSGQGWVRILYFTILIPHVILAAVVLPLSMLTLYRGLYDKPVLHRLIAKYTLPIWFYVSVSGVAVYFMLYHL